MFSSWKKVPGLVLGFNTRSFTDVRNSEPVTLLNRRWTLVRDRTFRIDPSFYPSALQFNTTFSWFLRWPLGLGIRVKKLALFVGFDPKKEGGYGFTVKKAWGQSSKPDTVETLPSFRESVARRKGEVRDLRAYQQRAATSTWGRGRVGSFGAPQMHLNQSRTGG